MNKIEYNKKPGSETADSRGLTPMLAKKYNGCDPAGWWMSEKLDGVRAIWDGSRLVSRTAKVFAAPEWFTAGLPASAVLDGELWEGRGKFQQTVGKVRTQYDPDWSGVEYVLFDLIAEGPFEQRLERLKELPLPSHARVLDQVRCSGQRHLQERLIAIISLGGEGVMLRRPGSLYEHKRSGALLKVKRFETHEAVVTGYEPGKGKYEGLVGALLCRFRDKLIEIGTGLTDELRLCPPAIGSRITFKFFELTEKGMPRFPVYLAERDYE